MEPTYTRHPRHAEELAATLPVDATLLVVSGGDGTISEVVNGLMQRPDARRPALFIIPGGSGNDTARMLNLRRDATEVERRLRERSTVQWDVIRAQITGRYDESITRYCINVMSTGITAEVSQLFNRTMRKLPPDIGYVLAAMVSFARYNPTGVHLRFDGGQTSARLLLVAMANNRWFGSGIGIAPQAVPDDGILNLTIAAGVSPLQFIGMLPRLRKAVEIGHPGVRYGASTTCQIDSESPIPVEIDGEFSGFTPLHATVIPRAITMVR